MANGGARGRWEVHKRVLLWTGFEPARLSPAELKSASLDHSDTIALDGIEPGTTQLRRWRGCIGAKMRVDFSRLGAEESEAVL